MDTREIKEFLEGVKEIYAISYNGEIGDKSVEDLLDRITRMLDEEEISNITRLLRHGYKYKAMAILAYGDTDFYFEQA